MNRSGRQITWRPVAVAVSAVMALVLSGCGTYVPEGSTVVAVKNSKREYERADLRPPQNELGNRRQIRMKWYDTNTFITSGTLEPGIYSFTARNFDGGAIQRNIRIEPDKDLYEIDEAALQAGDAGEDSSTVTEGPPVKGKILSYTAANRRSKVAVLFIGNDIIMETVQPGPDGTFSVTAPHKGQWKIEVHMLGPQPTSYAHPVTNITGAVDLGAIALK